jgi:hypothetical protein
MTSAVRLMAECEGLLIDPVYAGKAFAACSRISPAVTAKQASAYCSS